MIKINGITTLKPHYNTGFGIHSGINIVTEKCYNEALKHSISRYRQWEPCICVVNDRVIMRLQCINIIGFGMVMHSSGGELEF